MPLFSKPLRMVTAAALVATAWLAPAATGVAAVIYELTQFNGTIQSVDVFINGVGIVATGNITLSLDSSRPATITIDERTGQVAGNYSIIFNMPLLNALGLPPDSLEFAEQGTINFSHGPLVDATMEGFSVAPSPLYGISIGDINNNWHFNTSSSQEVTFDWETQFPDFTLIFPQNNEFDPNNVQVLSTSGFGTGSGVPLPATWLLFAPGLMGLLAYRRRS